MVKGQQGATMTVDVMQCDAAMHEFVHTISATYLEGPSLVVCEHISECSRCRAAILLLFLANSAVPLSPPELSCAECQANLAAYIDFEQAAPAKALQIFVGIWWHLWTCEECADIYSMACELQAEIPVQALDRHRSMSVPGIRLSWLPPILIGRDILQLILPQRFDPLAIVRGLRPQYLLFDGPLGEECNRQCVVWAMLLDDTNYCIGVDVQPPIAGAAVLRCGQLYLQSDFDHHGLAMMRTMPAALLTDADGPAIEIRFEEPRVRN